MVKEEGDVISKILDIFGIRLKNTESFGQKTIEAGEILINEYNEKIGFFNKKWSRMFEGKAELVGNGKEKTIHFF